MIYLSYIIRNARVEDANCIQCINETYLNENYPLIFWTKCIMEDSKVNFVAIDNKEHIIGYIFVLLLFPNHRRFRKITLLRISLLILLFRILLL